MSAAITVPVENDIQTLDPVVLSDPYTSRIVWQIYEGLVGLDREGNARPLLAESWSSSDQGRVWTFRIRPGVFFHKNGAFETPDSTRTVTADDVKYSYMRFARGFGSFLFSGVVQGFDEHLRGEAESISGFQVADSMTFRVLLTRPDPSFIFRITSPYLGIMPQEVVEANPDAFGRTVSAGTGPFQMESRSETAVTLRRSLDYWQQSSGNIERVTFRVDKNPQFRVTRFRNGNYDLLQLPISFVPQFLSGGELRQDLRDAYGLYTETTYNVHYMGIDCRQVTDANLRRAIAQGVNKAAILERLLYGQGRVATSPALPGMLDYRPPQGLAYSPEAARRTLQESRYNGVPLRLLVSDAPNSEQIGEIIQSNLRDVGITVQLEKVDFNTLVSRIFGENRPDLFLLFSEWVFGAPEHIIDVYNSARYPNPNMFGCGNERVDEILHQIPLTDERNRINELAYDAEAVALQDAPAVWLFHLRSIFLMTPRLDGFWVDKHNHWHLADVRVSD